MRRVIVLLLICVSLQSCSLLLNSKTQGVIIESAKPVSIAVDDQMPVDSITRKKIEVKRAKKPHYIRVYNKDIDTVLVLKHKLSPAFWWNIGFPYGAIADLFTVKRFGYRKNIYLDFSSGKLKIKRFAPTNRGTWCFRYSFPYVNSFLIKVENSYASPAGFMGVELGGDYYFAKEKFISVSAGGAANIPIPFPAPMRFNGYREYASSLYLNGRIGRNLRDAEVGAGVCYGNFYRGVSNNRDSTFVPKTQNVNLWGLSLNGKYRVARSFYVGLLYQPLFFRVSDNYGFNYNHLLSFEFLWKFRLNSFRHFRREKLSD